ncbi:MAG: class B sortase [Lachnospiraceae bacterium]|nr:class B sortase [Lachnospiraceae bacterium]
MSKIRWVILIAALAVFCYSGFRLFGILNGYREAKNEYASLADSYTTPKYQPEKEDKTEKKKTDSAAASSSAENAADGNEPRAMEFVKEPFNINGPAGDGDKEQMLIENAEVPLEVDWKRLIEANPEIAGWIYVDGVPGINYPVLKGEDNEYYLHHTFGGQYLFAGSIFEDYHNRSDFSDPNTIVYGHNMKDGSMFGKLKNLRDQAAYDADPYFWILTPSGNYRYHIFSVFTTRVDSDTYTLYSQNGPEFLKWEEKMKEQSEVKNDVPLSAHDKTVVLSTCTSDSSMRCVVVGKCVSSARPEKQEATGLTTVK